MVAIWDRNMYYNPWKEFITVVLCKPGKPRYNTPKVYRPIALLNTLGKVLTSIVAEPKVRFPSTMWFIYIKEDTLKLLLKCRNPNTTILGLTKTKYNDPRDSSYYYC